MISLSAKFAALLFVLVLPITAIAAPSERPTSLKTKTVKTVWFIQVNDIPLYVFRVDSASGRPQGIYFDCTKGLPIAATRLQRKPVLAKDHGCLKAGIADTGRLYQIGTAGAP